jgi:hypothetical protein
VLAIERWPLGADQEMRVVPQEVERDQLDRVHSFRPRQDTEDGLLDVGKRGEQQAALDGAAGHLDERPAFWDVT